MNNVNKTLYIPLYSKAKVSELGLFIKDKKAEEIWQKEGFDLKGKAKSKWLSYYLGIRSAVFDEWVIDELKKNEDATVIHIGCGMDSRVMRINNTEHKWYDLDFESVIEERKKYYEQSENYTMISADATDTSWLEKVIETKNAVIIMEGVSMYLPEEKLKNMIDALSNHFEKISLLMDSYTVLAKKMSKYKNPINAVGVTEVFGFDDPHIFNTEAFRLIKEHDMTPQKFIDELNGFEKHIFKKLFAGNFSKKLYKLYEYKKD